MTDRRPASPTLPPRSCRSCPVRRFALCEPVAIAQLDALRSGYFVLSGKTHLYRQGEASEAVYSLCAGWVLLYRLLQDGKRQVIRIALPGDFVGARPQLAGPSHHAAICLTESAFCAFPPLMEIVKIHADLAARLASLQAETLALTNDYLTYMGQRNAPARVAFLVLELYQRLRRRGLNGGATMAFPLTQEDIADALGLTAIHVNRVLHGLADRGLFTIQQHELTILDYEGLSEFADLDGQEWPTGEDKPAPSP